MKRVTLIIITFLASILAFFLVLYAWGMIFTPTIDQQEVVYEEHILAEVEELRDIDAGFNELLVNQVDVDYTEGKRSEWFPSGESPILAELVAEGQLPSVEERVGEEPLVLRGAEGIGNYGGTWFRVANSSEDVVTGFNRMSASTLVRWSPMGYPIRPNIAKGWEVSEDRREWTIQLRKGMKWSDGHPFTADDILYWWQDELPYTGGSALRWMEISGELGDIIKVDDYTLRFVFPKPYGNFLEILASNAEPYAPKHYLAKYLPGKGDADLIREQMAVRELDSERTLYSQLTNIRNPACPRLWPWIYRTYQSTPPESFVRNPYYWAVDELGNQLPYVDRILYNVKADTLIPISAAAGELTMQARHIRYEDYTLLMENRERGEYQVYHWFPAVRSVWTLWPNTNRRVEEGDPISAQKAALLSDKYFRQALSLALDREEIIRALYVGFGEPAQNAPGPDSLFHHEKLLKSFTEHAPERANAMLDELGLTERDSEGMRTFPDGSRMTWYIDYTSFTGEGPAQFVVDDWAEVGIRAVHRERTRPLFAVESQSLKLDFSVWSGESEFNPMVFPSSFVANGMCSYFALGNSRWYMERSKDQDTKQSGSMAIEPELGSAIRRGQDLYDEAVQAKSQEEQIEIFKKILDIAAEQVWSISIATPPPQLAVVKNGFRNVPHHLLTAYVYATPGNSAIETYYFENPQESPAALAQIKHEMTTITAAPEVVAQLGESGGAVGRLLGSLAWGIVILLLLMLAFRHPYIGRRFLIMLPTLVVISLIVFFVIQLPPGDFVESRILRLQMMGEDTAMEAALQLRETFHLDEPFFEQYARWMGLMWFTSFDSADKGLLQGDMGRSMETLRSVNSTVGDRVLLTFLVSLGTILFTWALAIPIGIYSAVRQYTIGDYVLSILGFIGMCVPNFLLAILIMYLSSEFLDINVTGLFSPDYAADPAWSWGKVGDLLQHIWVPIIVIGTGGTAGMIRIMRGNLLDELGKPYVTTARAKGVRPFRLLIKYPVRLALNPFVSGIGHLFPQLVSGGAIVAIVLSLPMVGPVLLQGLMTQDVYLAGSMLMVFSMLGVFGTLVSDLLLMWLDPRIRMGGGRK
jgi:ABC-type dipeptide/oligopeptide/nickel transport system permease component/ABC-type transport system substrate-binding protein